MLAGAFAFACMAVLTSELRDELAWQWIAAARSGLAMVFAAVLVVGAGVRFVFLRPSTLWMRSLAGSISLLCGFFAMTHYDVAIVLTLTNMYPLWVAVLSWPLLGVAPTRGTWIAACVGVAGVAVLSAAPMTLRSAPDPGPAEPAQQPAGSEQLVQQASLHPPAERRDYRAAALAASLVSAFTTAIALIGLHRLKGLDARAVVVHFSGVSLTLCLLATSLLPREPSLVGWSYAGLAMLLGVGISATVGQLFLTKAFAAGDPSRVSVVGLSQAGFALLMESFLHPRIYTPVTLLGMTLVLAPTAWVLLHGRLPGRLRRRADRVS